MSLSVMESPHYPDSFLSAQLVFREGIQFASSGPQETRAIFTRRGLHRLKKSASIWVSMKDMGGALSSWKSWCSKTFSSPSGV